MIKDKEGVIVKTWGGYRKGAGRQPLKEEEKKKGFKIYITNRTREDIEKYGDGNGLSDKANELINSELKNRRKI